MAGTGRPQFVLFGSSIVQISLQVRGWGSILADLYDRKSDIILRGYTGWNSRNAVEVLNQIFPQDAAVHPSLVIVYFGGNDAMKPHPSGLGPHVPLPEYVENMKKIALHLRMFQKQATLLAERVIEMGPIVEENSLGEKLRIIFLTCPPVHEATVLRYYGNMFDKQERTNEACRIYSEALVDLCQQMDIEVINLWTAFQHRDDWGEAYLSDGIHLSDGGSKVVAKEILKILREAEWEPSLYWLSMAAEFSDDSPYYSVASDGKTTVNVSDVVAEWKMEWMERSETEALAAKCAVSVPY